MADLTALQAALDKLTGDATTAIADIKNLLAEIAANSGDQAKVDSLTAEATAAASALEAVLPAPAAGTPPPAAPTT